MFVFDNKKFVAKVLNLPFKSFYILDSVEELEMAANLYRASLVMEISDCFKYLKANLMSFVDSIKVDKSAKTVSGSSNYYYHNHFINSRLRLSFADNDATRQKLIELKDIMSPLNESNSKGKYILFPLDLDKSRRVVNFDLMQYRVTQTTVNNCIPILPGSGISEAKLRELSNHYSLNLVVVKTSLYTQPDHSYRYPDAVLMAFMDTNARGHYQIYNKLAYSWNSDMSELYSAPGLQSIHSLSNTVNSLEKATIYINDMRGNISQCNPCENCVFATSKIANKCSFMSPRCTGITLPNIGGEAQWKTLRRK